MALERDNNRAEKADGAGASPAASAAGSKGQGSKGAGSKGPGAKGAGSSCPAGPGMSQKRRWLVFGANVVVAIMLVTALAIVAVWVSGVMLRGRARADWTTTGRFSLSPRTKAMLADLPCNITITNLYPRSPDTDEEYGRLQDLLSEYSMAQPGKITVETADLAGDPVAVKAVLDRLKLRYAKEAEAPKKAVAAFQAINRELSDLLTAEAKKMDAAAEALDKSAPDAAKGFQIVAFQWRQANRKGRAVSDSFDELTGEDQGLPQYTAALAEARDYLKAVGRALDAVSGWFTQIQDEMPKDAAVPAAAKMLFDAAKTTYEPIRQRLTDFERIAGAVKEGELDTITRDLSHGGVVLIETTVERGIIRFPAENLAHFVPPVLKPKDWHGTDAELEGMKPWLYRTKDGAKEVAELVVPAAMLEEYKAAVAAQGASVISAATAPGVDKVKILTYDEVWIRKPNPKSEEEADERLFAGESAVSSALLGICFKEKPAVLFVSGGGPATSYGGPYGEMANRLRKSNFIVQDWDIARQQEMPRPENASKIILVLLPPEPPNPQMPMPPPGPEQYRAVIDAVKGGAPAILLGQPSNFMQPPVPYADLFPLFGVTPKWDALAVHSSVVDPSTGAEKADEQVVIAAYANHPITQSMNALPSMFFMAAPLMIKGDLPEGVTAEALASLPNRPDYWAETNLMSFQRGVAKRDTAEDLTGSLPLAVAATRKVGSGEQKVVMFGCATIAQSRVAFARDFLGREWFPGNAELFVNSVLWVSGSEHLITVSPEALQARRIGDPGAWMLPLQIGLIGGLPVVVLVAGIVVYLIRRR